MVLRAKAIQWYHEHAKVFFDEQRTLITALLDQPDADTAMTPFLKEQTYRVEEALYTMPEKNRFVPSLFHAGSHMDARNEELD